MYTLVMPKKRIKTIFQYIIDYDTHLEGHNEAAPVISASILDNDSLLLDSLVLGNGATERLMLISTQRRQFHNNIKPYKWRRLFMFCTDTGFFLN